MFHEVGPMLLRELLSAVLPWISEGLDPSFCEKVTGGEKDALRLTQAAERLRAQPYSAHARSNDLRFHLEAGVVLLAANASAEGRALDASATLRAVGHRLAVRKRDVLPVGDVVARIRKLRVKIAQARRLPLETELQDIAGRLLDGRNLDIALLILGWDGFGPKTMRGVGAEYGVSHQRVYYLIHRFCQRIQYFSVYAPALDRVLRAVPRRLPVAAADLERRFLERGLTKGDFRLEGVITAARILGRPVPFEVKKVRGVRTAIRPGG